MKSKKLIFDLPTSADRETQQHLPLRMFDKILPVLRVLKGFAASHIVIGFKVIVQDREVGNKVLAYQYSFSTGWIRLSLGSSVICQSRIGNISGPQNSGFWPVSRPCMASIDLGAINCASLISVSDDISSRSTLRCGPWSYDYLRPGPGSHSLLDP